ncbi:acetylglutamate kinase [Pseudobacteriovorax antillogorgiicola]|uniref:Acetylglutamate kinase n=1 Tax=Pseudobacteriovorax antillogorgiicola TaxID=1513793 RepID=A0A1Y6C9A4_9BACT|nr:acetylglutamate kinase [Pseudobacteriovorax antillogorgiicola]TCS51685.1 N-acetylglutamate kinase [Pseudobacteriovorax antillogorgiicola]SMF49078.1 N-acetylglutamate kinase [Pseudobacteriovorax antillogorgiicola]
MSKPLTIVKVGGKVIEDQAKFEAFLDQFAAIEGPKILVHGGGVMASQLAELLGIPVNMIDGRRVTCQKTIDVVTMVYAGKINKTIAAQLNRRLIPAIGLCGADNFLVKAKRRPNEPIDFGFVGDVTGVNHEFLNHLLQGGLTPVLAPLSCDETGQILNTNGDTIASAVASAMCQLGYKVTLLYMTNLAGVMEDPRDAASLIPRIDQDLAKTLHQTGVVSDGMLPKLDNCFVAKRSGAVRVAIGHWQKSRDLTDPTMACGTEIVL